MSVSAGGFWFQWLFHIMLIPLQMHPIVFWVGLSLNLHPQGIRGCIVSIYGTQANARNENVFDLEKISGIYPYCRALTGKPEKLFWKYGSRIWCAYTWRYSKKRLKHFRACFHIKIYKLCHTKKHSEDTFGSQRYLSLLTKVILLS